MASLEEYEEESQDEFANAVSTMNREQLIILAIDLHDARLEELEKGRAYRDALRVEMRRCQWLVYCFLKFAEALQFVSPTDFNALFEWIKPRAVQWMNNVDYNVATEQARHQNYNYQSPPVIVTSQEENDIDDDNTTASST